MKRRSLRIFCSNIKEKMKKMEKFGELNTTLVALKFCSFYTQAKLGQGCVYRTFFGRKRSFWAKPCDLWKVAQLNKNKNKRVTSTLKTCTNLNKQTYRQKAWKIRLPAYLFEYLFDCIIKRIDHVLKTWQWLEMNGFVLRLNAEQTPHRGRRTRGTIELARSAWKHVLHVHITWRNIFEVLRKDKSKLLTSTRCWFEWFARRDLCRILRRSTLQ